MRLVTAIALLFVLMAAAPALAQGGLNDLDTDKQVKGYGNIFGYVCGLGAALGIIIFIHQIIKNMHAEHARGKKKSPFREEILDEKPKVSKVEELFMGERVPEWKIDNRQRATKAALKLLALGDDMYDKKTIATAAVDAFLAVKIAIEERSTKNLAKMLTAECLEKLQADIQQLRDEKEVRVFGTIEVTRIEFVHLEAPDDKKAHTVTVLVSAKSKNYVKDDKTGEILRGDKKLYSFQEFWRFRRKKSHWLAERIRESGDMDRLLATKNVLSKGEMKRYAKNANPEYLREFVNDEPEEPVKPKRRR